MYDCGRVAQAPWRDIPQTSQVVGVPSVQLEAKVDKSKQLPKMKPSKLFQDGGSMFHMESGPHVRMPSSTKQLFTTFYYLYPV